MCAELSLLYYATVMPCTDVSQVHQRYVLIEMSSSLVYA